VRYTYKYEFQPIALPEEKIILLTDGKELKPHAWFKVTEVLPLPMLQLDFGAINAGGFATSPRITEATVVPNKVVLTRVLEMPDLQLAQWRFRVLDDIQIKLFQPTARAVWVLKTQELWLDKRIEQIDPTLQGTEFYQFENREIAFQVRNPTEEAINLSRVLLRGWRLRLEKLPERPAPPYTKISLGGE